MSDKTENGMTRREALGATAAIAEGAALATVGGAANAQAADSSRADGTSFQPFHQASIQRRPGVESEQHGHGYNGDPQLCSKVSATGSLGGAFFHVINPVGIQRFPRFCVVRLFVKCL